MEKRFFFFKNRNKVSRQKTKWFFNRWSSIEDEDDWELSVSYLPDVHGFANKSEEKNSAS